MGAPMLRYPWGSGGIPFAAALELPITAAVPAAQTLETTVACTHDTYLKQDASDTNYGNTVMIYINPITSTSATVRGIFRYATITAPQVGATLTSAKLYLNYYAYYSTFDPKGRTYTVYEMDYAQTPANAWVEGAAGATGATWDHYEKNGGLAWTGGHTGADGDKKTSPAGVDFVLPNPSTYGWVDAAGGHTNLDITAIVQDAITNNGGVVNLYVKDKNEGGSTNYIPMFASHNHGTPAIWSYIALTWSYTPPSSELNPYVLNVSLFKGSPTVEVLDSDATVNSRVFGYRYGPIKIDTFSTVPINSVLAPVIDTKSLVAYGTTKMFADTGADGAYTVEFVMQSGTDYTTNDCKYYVQTALGVPEDFNTGGTHYYVETPFELTANTTYYLWLYADYRRHGETSSNYGTAGVPAGVGYFEDFATDKANLADFLAYYTDWEVDTASSPDANDTEVVSSVLTVKGTATAGYEHLAIKTAAFQEDNFHCLMRFTGTGGQAGVIDVDGMDELATGNAFLLLWDLGAHYFSRYNAGAATVYHNTYPTVPFISDISVYGTTIRMVTTRGSADNQPANWGNISLADLMWNLAIGDESGNGGLKVTVGSSTAAVTMKVDWVLCYTQVEKPPNIKAPSVTYRGPGMIFGEDTHLNFPYDTAFTLPDSTVLNCGPDYKSQLTSDPGDSIQLAVEVAADCSANQTIYCYAGHADITKYTPHDHWDNEDTWEDFCDFRMPPAWVDNYDYVVGDRVEGDPTGVREGLSVGEDGGLKLYGVNWGEQSFTASASYTITSAKLLLYRSSTTLTVPITVSVRAVDVNHKPTGADLCSGSIYMNTLDTPTAGVWREFTFGAGTALTSGTEYCLVVRAISATSSKSFYWKYDSGAGYASGQYGTSGDSGSTWTLNSGRDFMFQTYGGVAKSNTAYTCLVAHNSGDYDDMSDALTAGMWQADWLNETGTWTTASYIEPVISHQLTGNVGATVGRTWVRQSSVFAWNGKYYCISGPAQWETSGLWWPDPYRTQIYEADVIGTRFGPPVHILDDGLQSGMASGGWHDSVWVDGTYGAGGVIYSCEVHQSPANTPGIRIWACSAADPMIPSNWSVNPTILLDATWLAANGDFVTGDIVSTIIYKRGSVWYLIMSIGDAAGDISYTSTTDNDPLTWVNADFEATGVVQLAATGEGHLEDMSIAQCTDSGVEATYIYYTVPVATNPNEFLRYIKLHEDAGEPHTFPAAGHWEAPVDVDWDQATWALGKNNSPRIFDNKAVDGYVYLFNSGMPENESPATAFEVWCPNWVQCTRGTDYINFDMFTVTGISTGDQPSSSKYKQTNTAIFAYASKTGTSYGGLEASVEVQISNNGARAGGIIFRHDATNNNGYFACLDYNAAETSYVRLYEYLAGTLTEIGTAYTIPAWPDPGGCGYLHLNMPWRLRVTAYGTAINVYYSKWGEPWILAKTASDSTYLSGLVGLATNLSEAVFDNFRVKTFINVEPALGEAEWTYFTRGMWSNF